MSTVSDAAYHTVHDYPGGAESLAPRMELSAQVLRNKVAPNCMTHRQAHLTTRAANDL